MGTMAGSKRYEEYGKGSWTNPEVQAENWRAQAELQAQPLADQAFLPPASSAQPQRYQAQLAPDRPSPSFFRRRSKPRLSLFRRLICSLLALLALLLGLGSAGAYWAQTNLVDTERFSQVTADLAYDPDFQASLATAVTGELMASPVVSSYLGDGNSSAWYGGVQNWLYDQTYSLVDGATQSLVASEAYPQVWAQVIADTHAYNFSGQSRPAQLDLSALYDRAGQSVGAATGLSLDTSSLPGRTITLDSAQNFWPINSAINSLIWLASLWQLLLILSAGCLLLGFLLWPRNRFAYLAFVAFIGSGLLWLLGLIGGGLSLTAGLNLPAGGTALLFVQKLSEILTASFASFHYDWAFNLLIAGAVLTLMAFLSAILGLSTRLAPAQS